jgi:phage head maturation protease
MSLIFRTFGLASKAYDEGNPLSLVIMPPNDKARVRRFIASDDTVDRYAEVVMPDGIELQDYARNPVVMSMHDYEAWPLGHAIAAGVVDGKLMVDVEFDPPDVDPDAEKVMRKIDLRTVNACSIGFEPLEWYDQGKASAELKAAYPQARRIYTRSKLLELTICPIPANPNALAAALQRSILLRHGIEVESQPNSAPAGSDTEWGPVLDRIEKMQRTK